VTVFGRDSLIASHQMLSINPRPARETLELLATRQGTAVDDWRDEQPGKLTAFHEALKQALKVDAYRPKHERRTALALYIEIQAAGYEGGYTRVTDFIRQWRLREGQAVQPGADRPRNRATR